MQVHASLIVASTTVEVVEDNLLGQPVEGIMLSANNRLEGKTGWAGRIRPLADPTYDDLECRELAQSAGSAGLRQGSAVVTGGYLLASGNLRRRVIQAITIAYRDGDRIPATPEVVYRAVRSGLEIAELYRLSSVATYIMAARPGYGTQPPEVMAEALCRAVIDHAEITSSISRLVICELPPTPGQADRIKIAGDALRAAFLARYSR